MAKKLTPENLELLKEWVMEPRPTVPSIPPEVLHAQAAAAALLIRRPGPHCGDTRPARAVWSNDPFEPDSPLWQAECQRCGARGPVGVSAEDAVRQWDARVANG